MKIHSKLSFQKQLYTALLQINNAEIGFLKREKNPFENGNEFHEPQHPYSYDLDIFGEHSLFQHLNRTATFIGKKTLANLLLNPLTEKEIIANQNSIKELKEKLEFRQHFLALAQIGKDSKMAYENLLKWNSTPPQQFSKFAQFYLYAGPILFLGIVIGYFLTSNTLLIKLVTYVFIANLMFLGYFIKKIKAEIAPTYEIDRIINQYSLLVQAIENQTFASAKLQTLQKQLYFENTKASTHLKQLSELFSKMDSIANLITASLFNGTFLYNAHILKALWQWKAKHATALEDWLNIIGEFEMLNSLANYSYNNPDFVFPELNSNFNISFDNLSHPLLNPQTRIGNDVRFQPESFIILTGSNMSGKSTFLRSLGINMVLGCIGAPVCATKAQLHPLPILVSMRLSDSLSDSESYFFAEIKRLHQIMEALNQQPAFVLLDEILRGTNSDDKRNGTIEVIKKIISKNAIGAIATHDVEVCLTTNAFPEKLKNQCFEAQIIANELHFDYCLRDGICQNKSATFLMQKMGII
ncbi:MutS-related protein [Flavobacterium agrisoli]|nr:DNA mismatch repair protein [Flavobacterium agrisoli]